MLVKFSVNTDQLIDYWALTGDTTNKIPGVAGIGPVTATELLKEHGSVAAILAADNLKRSVANKMKDAEMQTKLAQQLLTLKQDIPLGFNLKDIRLHLEAENT